MTRALLTTVVLTFASSVATAETITVCLDGWCDYTDIQEAIDAASDGDVIAIGAGTYYPAATIDTIGKAVTLRGEVGKDGAPTTVIDGQDSIRVLICQSGETSETAFENLVIQNGSVTGSSPNYLGGGMYNDASSPTLTNCTFEGNSADNGGGGMHNSNSSPTLENCTFTGNSADDSGGGMVNWNSSPTLTGCTFNGNSAKKNGGGISSSGFCNGTLEHCTFTNNSATERGGGMYDSNDSNPTLTNCTFAGNSAQSGGGMSNLNHSSPTLTGCTFVGNSAAHGGGMYFFINCNPTLVLCTFKSNSADMIGGGMHSHDSSATLENCSFVGNTSGQLGGGMSLLGSEVMLTGCTFTECCKIFPAHSFTNGGGNEFAGNPYEACDACRADFNCFNDEVNSSDLNKLLNAWDTTDALYDLNGDGVVGGEDLGLLFVAWGPC